MPKRAVAGTLASVRRAAWIATAAAALFAVARISAADSTAFLDEARAKVRRHDVRGALAALDKAIAADPSDADAHMLRQDVGRDVLGVEALATTYRQKASEKPDDPILAFLYARLLPPDAALTTYEKQITQFPTSPWPHAGHARALEAAARFPEAAAEYQQAVVLAPRDTRFKAYQAFGLEAAGDWAGALEAWKIVVNQTPKDRAARFGLGESLRRTGAADDAIALFTDILKTDPTDVEAQYRLGLADEDGEKLDDALKAFDAAIAGDRAFVGAYCAAAEASIKKALETAAKEKRDPVEKDFEKAIAYGTKAAAVGGDRPEAHCALAAAYEAAGEDNPAHFDQALTEYDAALNLLPIPCPEKVRAYCAKSYVLMRRDKCDLAIAAADKAIGIDPNCAAAYAHGGDALAAEDKNDEAIKSYYKKGLKVAPDDAHLHHALGLAQWRLSTTGQEAKKELEAAVKLEPKNPRYCLSLGQLYDDLKMYHQAADLLLKVVETRPGDVEGWRSFGRVCCQLKDWEQGVLCYEKIVALLTATKPAAPAAPPPGGAAPDAPAAAPGPTVGDEDLLRKAHLYLGLIFDVHLKNRAKAKEHVRKFVDLGGQDDSLKSWIDDILADK